MELKDIPYNGWFFGLKHRDIQNKTLDAIESSEDIAEARKKITVNMIEIMTECTRVIHHANTMEPPTECTCTGNCGDKK